MANDNPIRNFTAADIERYQKGQLSPRERHALEKAALDDPFLADAIEGYSTTETNIAADLSELKKRLSDRYEEKKVIPVSQIKKPAPFPWLRVAALFVILAGAALLIYRVGFSDKKAEMAQAPQSQAQQQTSQEQQRNTTPPGLTTTDTTGTFGTLSYGTPPTSGNISGTTSTGNTNYLTVDKGADSSKTQTQIIVGETAASAKVDQKETSDFATALPDKKDADDIVARKTVEKPANAAMSKDKARFDTAVVFSEGVVSANKMNEYKQRKLATDNNNYYRNANTFRGRVIDNNNNPVPFANVTNTEDNVGTYADARGYFNLTSPDSILNVEVRGLGYNNYNTRLLTVPNNQVVLQEDRNLDEVVLSNKKPNATSRAKEANMKMEGEPEPEDGWDNYDSYLANNLNVPEDYKIKKSGAEEVKVSFEVNKYGEPINIRVEKSLCGRCDQEAIRLIKEGPKWKRKARKGRTTVTISF